MTQSKCNILGVSLRGSMFSRALTQKPCPFGAGRAMRAIRRRRGKMCSGITLMEVKPACAVCGSIRRAHAMLPRPRWGGSLVHTAPSANASQPARVVATPAWFLEINTDSMIHCGAAGGGRAVCACESFMPCADLVGLSDTRSVSKLLPRRLTRLIPERGLSKSTAGAKYRSVTGLVCLAAMGPRQRRDAFRRRQLIRIGLRMFFALCSP